VGTPVRQRRPSRSLPGCRLDASPDRSEERDGHAGSMATTVNASSLREVVGGGLREQQGVFATDSLRKRLMRSVGLRAPWICSSCDESVKKWRIRMTTPLSYLRTAFAADWSSASTDHRCCAISGRCRGYTSNLDGDPDQHTRPGCNDPTVILRSMQRQRKRRLG